MKVIKRQDGYWLIEPYNHPPIDKNGKREYGEEIAGPFNRFQNAVDYILKMDYHLD